MADELRWSTERDSWLTLAAGVEATPPRVSQLSRAEPSEDVVAASRELYLTAADRAARAAKRAKRWNDLARIRREEAAASVRGCRQSDPATWRYRRLAS